MSVPETATVSETVPASETVPVPDAAPPDPAAIEHLRETGVTVKRVGVIGHDLRFWRVTDADGRQGVHRHDARRVRDPGPGVFAGWVAHLDTEGSTPLYRSEPERARPRVGSIDRSALQAGDRSHLATAEQAGAADTSGPTPLGRCGTNWATPRSSRGKAGAPLVYCFFDPYCPYCHQQWNTLRKKVSAGTLCGCGGCRWPC